MLMSLFPVLKRALVFHGVIWPLTDAKFSPGYSQPTTYKKQGACVILYVILSDIFGNLMGIMRFAGYSWCCWNEKRMNLGIQIPSSSSPKITQKQILISHSLRDEVAENRMQDLILWLAAELHKLNCQPHMDLKAWLGKNGMCKLE